MSTAIEMRRDDGPASAVVLTAGEAAAIATIFADDLARGWIPRRLDIEDALGLLRAR